MEKRSEQRKLRREKARERRKRMSAFVFCALLLLCSIYTVDASVKKMLLCKDDRHALALSRPQSDLLRVDLAGEKFVFNIRGAVELTNTTLQYIEQLYSSTVNKVMEYKNH